MNRIPDWVWESYEAMPRQVQRRVKVFVRFLRSLAQPVPVAVLRGPVKQHDQPASVILAGVQPWVEYLPHLFFEGPPKRDAVGKVPLWALPRTLERLAPSANLVIARLDRISARLLFDASYLVVPEWVDVWLTMPDDLAAMLSRSGSVQRDLQRVHKHGLRHEISHADADFDQWYDHFYVPFIRKRHAKYGYLVSRRRMRRYFRVGELLWVLQGGQRIAGMLIRKQGEVLHGHSLGTLDGDYTVVRIGAMAALYYYTFQYARAQRCPKVHFGGSRPILTYGDLRYKRKWGMRLVERGNSYVFLVRWNRLDESVLAFLTETPLTFRDQGQLSVVAAIDCEAPATEKEAEEACRFLWMPGLHRLYLLSASGWEPSCKPPPRTRLIDLAADRRGELPAFLAV